MLRHVLFLFRTEERRAQRNTLLLLCSGATPFSAPAEKQYSPLQPAAVKKGAEKRVK